MNVPTCDFEAAQFLLFSEHVHSLVYYAHFSVFVMAMFFGFFVFFRGKHKLANRIFLFIMMAFCLWVLLSAIFWASNRSDIIMLDWSVTVFVEILIYAGSFYFAYVMVYKKDLPLKLKIISTVLIFPVISTIHSRYSLSHFELTTCLAEEGFIDRYYAYAVEFVFSLLVLIFSFKKYRIEKQEQRRKEILLLTIGIVFFLVSFSWGNIIGSFTDDWQLAQVGFLGMPVFLGFLSYLIVRHRTFGIRLHEIQILVAGLVFLIGSQLLYVKNFDDAVISAITCIITFVIGVVLIRSIRRTEKEKQEKLEKINQKLESANRVLINLDKAKTEFINIASHQLRTPTTVIKGISSMMKAGHFKKFSEEDQSQFYESLWNKSKKLEDIINDILSAASLTNRKYMVEDSQCQEIDMQELLEKIIQDFEAELNEKRLKLEFEVMQNLPKIKAQKDDLEDAFENIINNAIKYMPSTEVKPGIIKIIINCYSRKPSVAIAKDGEGGNPLNDENVTNLSSELVTDNFLPELSLLISITDNGIGIPKDEISKLFAKFYRATNAKQTYTDGSGLGLFIAKEIIDGHGGQIWVESELGRGTTFYIKLPILEEKE